VEVLSHFRSAAVVCDNGRVVGAAFSWIQNYDQGCKVWRDGGASDEIRLAGVAGTARRLESRVVIGSYLDVLPLPGRPIEGDTTADLEDHARKLGDEMEEVLAKRLRLLDRLTETRPCFEICAIAPAARCEGDDA
jgi:stage III sporulation protein SpoIIIAA